MNLYKIIIHQYSTSVKDLKEVEAEEVRFEGVSINFYKKDRLIYSSPGAMTRVYDIEYKKGK